MRFGMALFLFFGALGAVASAASEPAPVPDPATHTVTVFHWWTSPSEAAALDALVAAFESRHPELSVEPTNAGRGTAAILPVLTERAAANQAPEATLAHGGYSPDSLIAAGLLSPVDDVWTAEKLEAVIPAAIREMVRRDGHYYVVPLGIHRDNVLWYNQPLLAKHGIDPATLTTWEALFQAARKLQQGGVEAPIQIGATWTVVHVFACMMASQGIAGYEDWANGRIREAGDARVRTAFELLAKYVGLANKDHVDLDWDVAIGRVASGEAAFAIMGDWANAVFQHAGLQLDEDYGARLVPGTEGMYGVTLDGFARPARLAQPQNAERWLRLAASRDGQDVFNTRKGSIPARTDADVARYGAYQRAAIEDFKRARLLFPGFGTAMPDAYQAEMQTVMNAFLADRDVRRAEEALAAASQRVAGSYTRVWALK
jgi:glucose/mannose transport system substrate-binding protein